jgi:hypothetical protein
VATHKACLAEHYKWTLTAGKPGRDVVPPSPPLLERDGERREHAKTDEGGAEAGLQRTAEELDSQLRTWRNDRSRGGPYHTITHTGACVGRSRNHLSRGSCVCVCDQVRRELLPAG